MKQTLTVIQILLIGLLFLSAPLVNAQQTGVEEVDHIVAIVNEDVVVKSELNNEIGKVVSDLRQQQKRLPAREVIERQVLDRLILKKLQLAAAERVGINISEDILAQTIGNIARRNKLSLSQMRNALESEGINFRRFKNNLREQMSIQQLKEQEVVRRIRVTEQEVNAFLARQSSGDLQRTHYLLYHILIETPEGASSDQLASGKEKAERIVGELRAGADFQTTALSESDGRQALEGGNLGWRAANQLPTTFIEQIGTMERGAISNPIRTPSGYHIIKLEDYKGGDRQIVMQTKVRHILLTTNEVTSNEDALTRLEQLRKRILGGDAFDALARSHSDDKSSAIKGGELGWINPGDTLALFEEEIGKLKIDEIGEPFQTEFGWHLVQVLDRREHDSTQEVQKAKARKAIQKRKANEQSELYLRRLRDEAYVEILLNNS